MAHKRISKELLDIQKQPPANCSIESSKQDPFQWYAKIFGRDGTPYSNGIFCLDILFSKHYPFMPPKVRFTTKIYHPNINSNGAFSLEIFHQWSPAYTISMVLKILQQLLNNADVDNPLESQIAEIYKQNKAKFNENARQWTQKYAS